MDSNSQQPTAFAHSQSSNLILFTCFPLCMFVSHPSKDLAFSSLLCGTCSVLKFCDVTKLFLICCSFSRFWLCLLFRSWSWLALIFQWFSLLTFPCFVLCFFPADFGLSAVSVLVRSSSFAWAYFCDCFVVPALWLFVIKNILHLHPLWVCFVTRKLPLSVFFFN